MHKIIFTRGGGKVPLVRSNNWFAVQVSSKEVKHLKDILPGTGVTQVGDIRPERRIYWLEANNATSIEAGLKNIKTKSKIVKSYPIYIKSVAGSKIYKSIIFDEICVKFIPSLNRTDIEKINKQFGVEIISSNQYGEYVLRLKENSLYTTLEVANKYFEKKYAVYSEPNFIQDMVLHDDPLYSSQWYLNNTGQLVGGLSDIDINAPQAWALLDEGPHPLVAVFDDGINYHEDLDSSLIITGWTPPSLVSHDIPSNGLPGYSDGHGEEVAGIIAAQHNGKGARGIAPFAKLMSMKLVGHYYDNQNHLQTLWASQSEIAVAIDTARERGADILSNSWGTGDTVHSSAIDNALSRALNAGRDSLGCIVVASAGNNGHLKPPNGFVQYPATYPGVIAVGAISYKNERMCYSPSDSRIDLVAPSGGNCDVDPNDGYGLDRIVTYDTLVTTTARMGSGEIFYNYTLSFGGTSASAPMVSGVAAMLLSWDPYSSGSDVRNRIINNATSLGSHAWAGSGRLNAYAALLSFGKRATRKDSKPKRISLHQNYPNPFNPTTIIGYDLPAEEPVTIKIYNVLGQEIKTLLDGVQKTGYRSVLFRPENLPSGLYFYRLQTERYIEVKTMSLVK